ncbi:putative type I restriction-modification system, M subunit [Bacillus anthracis]|nr:putative type I restriction-modification system, M subunit [Bacillus anthracis]
MNIESGLLKNTGANMVVVFFYVLKQNGKLIFKLTSHLFETAININNRKLKKVRGQIES